MTKELTAREIEVISDTEFLISKRAAINKIDELLSYTHKKLSDIFNNSTITFPSKNKFSTGKISRGENYRGLPYLVLDYPAVFLNENIFAFRTMFYWGHFFSTTLHLQDESLNYYRDRILDNFNDLLHKNIYISVGETPWEYHYGLDNYELLIENHKGLIKKCSFLKLSKKIDIKDWHQVPEFASDFYKILLEIIE